MKGRKLIKSQIIKAWKDTIYNDYCSQRINSERSLQALFCSHLKERLTKNRRLFIEPGISIQTKKGKKNISPDIVVCNTIQVISVIELKYLPRAQPKYEDDIEKLDLISKHRQQLSITNVRFLGTEKDSKEYTFSKNILFVWASIHKKEKQLENKLFSIGYKSLENCYMQLHAETKLNSKPKVYYKT